LAEPAPQPYTPPQLGVGTSASVKVTLFDVVAVPVASGYFVGVAVLVDPVDPVVFPVLQAVSRAVNKIRLAMNTNNFCFFISFSLLSFKLHIRVFVEIPWRNFNKYLKEFFIKKNHFTGISNAFSRERFLRISCSVLLALY
jgi:hypothetical protein